MEEIQTTPRTRDEIQVEYNQTALKVGDMTYRHAVMTQEIPQLHQKMLGLNQEMLKISQIELEATK